MPELTLTAKVEKLITYLLRLPGGLNVLLGTRPLSLYVESTEEEDAVAASAGGWEHIGAMTREWIKMRPDAWKIIMEHSIWVRGNKSRVDGSQLDKVAEKFGVARRTVCKLVKKFPQELAAAILNSLEDKGGYICVAPFHLRRI